MSELFLTPTRRRRLEQVDAAEVYRDEVGVWHHPTGFKLTAELDALEAAGWVRRIDHPVISVRELYILTDAGKAVLAPPAVGDIPTGSVWRDLVNKGRRLRVEHVDELQVSVLVTYSPAVDAFERTLTTDVVPRGEWTAQRYVPESTPDGAA